MHDWVNRVIFASSLGLLSPHILAHGEDKPGPHGGVIRMPGAFHTEVVQKDPQTINVYLLDIAFQDPVVANSSVAGTITQNGQSFSLECSKETTLFTCTVEGSGNLSHGELNLDVTRNGSRADDVIYNLPLQVPNAQPHDLEHTSKGH